MRILRGFFWLLGVVAILLAAGAAGGLGVMIALGQVHQKCTTGLLCDAVRQLTAIQAIATHPDQPASVCLTAADRRQIYALAAATFGHSASLAGLSGTKEESPCLSVERAVEDVCNALQGGWSGSSVCKSLGK